MPEVDHEKLVRKLHRDYDGWALSLSADSLPFVLAIVRRVVDPKRFRICIWVKGSRKGTAYRARNAWEPLIVVSGRSRQLSVAEDLDDVLVWGGRQHSHPRALVGMKPAPFCEWMFRLLGALPCDELVDVFPGSGAVMRAWRMFTGQSGSKRRTSTSRLVEAQRKLSEARCSAPRATSRRRSP